MLASSVNFEQDFNVESAEEDIPADDSSRAHKKDYASEPLSHRPSGSDIDNRLMSGRP